MILQYLDFERPIIDLENRLEQLRRLDDGTDKNLREEEGKLEKKIAKIRKEIFSNLTRWQITQLARHPNRPYMLDYVNLCFKNFRESQGGRVFRDDPSIVGGFAELDSEKVMLIGQQKGRNTTEKISRNFGMAHPEGYRKALRLMKLAEKFRLPVITVIDTPGAFPGIGAEERGQSEAIARNLLEVAELHTPPPQSRRLGVVARITPEPEGGPHRDHKAAADAVKSALVESLASVRSLPARQLLDRRYAKVPEIGRIKPEAGGAGGG